MARGYTTTIRPDGLIVARPKRQGSPISGRSVLLFVAAFILFKGFLIASLGPATYDERVARLSVGTPVERAGALTMQIDPLSAYAADRMRRLIAQLPR
jgi:hypothetical protein